jgi:Pyruvate/2-oxoglutarate dehydrogenase complex, dehydrogenase (E1) component, eukaryotic type, beta subunit
MESIYAHYPGLIVMTPATVEDAYTMLVEAVAIDDPVIYCEHKYLYYHLKADKLPEKGLPTGRARIAREGRDLTIVSYSAMMQESLAAAEELAREGFEVEVVDLRTVKPLDTDTVLASVARTGRLLCVGESFPWGGATAEVIARVTSQGFICSMHRRNVSTRKTLRFHTTQIFGARIDRTRKILSRRRGNCFENRVYAAGPNHHAAAGRIDR